MGDDSLSLKNFPETQGKELAGSNVWAADSLCQALYVPAGAGGVQEVAGM